MIIIGIRAGTDFLGVCACTPELGHCRDYLAIPDDPSLPGISREEFRMTIAPSRVIGSDNPAGSIHGRWMVPPCE